MAIDDMQFMFRIWMRHGARRGFTHIKIYFDWIFSGESSTAKWHNKWKISAVACQSRIRRTFNLQNRHLISTFSSSSTFDSKFSFSEKNLNSICLHASWSINKELRGRVAYAWFAPLNLTRIIRNFNVV